MNKFRRIIIGLALCMPLLWGCSENEIDPVGHTRTVLIYMAADNSLSSYSYKNIESIVQGTSKTALNGGNLLVYVDASDATPQLLQIKVKSDGTIQKLSVKDYAEQNSADAVVMRAVFDEVLAAFPADSYGLVLWSHGTAWIPTENGYPMLRSFGQDESNWMEIDELAEALPDHVFDFIMFDACYMASTEVAYAFQNKADYILASPTEILGEGFPYKLIIGDFFTETTDLQQIAETFYNYYNQQSGLYQSASVSLIATEQLDELAAISRQIVFGKETAIAALPIQELQQLEYLGDTFHALYDLDDFISRLATNTQYTNFLTVLNKVVLYKKTTPNATYTKGQLAINKFSGLSIYVPQDGLASLNDWYKGLAWYKAVYE